MYIKYDGGRNFWFCLLRSCGCATVSGAGGYVNGRPPLPSSLLSGRQAGRDGSAAFAGDWQDTVMAAGGPASAGGRSDVPDRRTDGVQALRRRRRDGQQTTGGRPPM